MNYGLLWKEVVFNRKAMDIVERATNAELTWHQGKIHNSLKDNRSSNVAWIGDQDLLSMLLRMVKKINKDARWNLNITGVEAVQYGI